MTALVGCDLDRTLVYSAAALMLDGPDEAAPSLVVAEVYEGAPLSYLTRAAEDLLVALAARACVVPVTTRTVAQYRRVRLPFSPEWAVTSNGAVILHDGEPDEQWAGALRAEISASCAPMADVVELLGVSLPPAAVLRVRDAESLFVYAIVDRAVLTDGHVAAFAAALAPLGWTVSLQGRKLYAVPVPIRKERALAAVAERIGATTTIAAGDSLLDRDMLRWADLGVRPAHGELDAIGWTAPNTVVTERRGVLAGEELLRTITAAVERAG
ncbi:HAD family hydrolase [Curtobacterium sp. 9128]|uniref:HAD family hydrolase n=1 Tax=Curtobacterium sp. 9128 TaxID=1793722 RepID=UPI0011A11C54|nr:HAD family hydrolase [Curtobacterium sp. 9128]